MEKKFNTPGEMNAQILIKGPIDFADKEHSVAADKKNVYFKKEICDIEEMLGKTIVWMISKSKNNETNAENMQVINR